MSVELMKKKKHDVVLKFCKELDELLVKYEKYLAKNTATVQMSVNAEQLKLWQQKSVMSNPDEAAFTSGVLMKKNKIIP